MANKTFVELRAEIEAATTLADLDLIEAEEQEREGGARGKVLRMVDDRRSEIAGGIV